MKNITIPLLLSVLFSPFLLTTLAADKPDDTKEIQGSWLMASAVLHGQTMGEDFTKIFTMKLDNGNYLVTAESPDKGTYTVNPAATPKTIDINGVEGPNAGKKILGIYELQGNTLRICYNLGAGPRPTEFKCPAGSQIFLVTYKRKKA